MYDDDNQAGENSNIPFPETRTKLLGKLERLGLQIMDGRGEYLVVGHKPTLLTSRPVSLGVKKLKRGLLGFCGYSSLKTSHEIAKTFIKIGLTDDLNEAVEMVPGLLGHDADFSYGLCLYLSTKEVRSPSGRDRRYLVSKHSID